MKRTILAGLTAALLFVAPSVHRVGAEAPLYTVQDLGTLDGLVPNVTGLNASGELSGYVSGDAGPRAVRYRDGAWSYVPGLENMMSVAFAINDHGDLTGYHFTADGPRAFRYVDGTGVEVIEPLPGGSVTLGMAINNNGEVVGQGNTAAGSRGFRAARGLPAVEIPTLGGSFGTACGINDLGQVVGTSSTESEMQHAYRVEENGTLTDLGAFDGDSGTSAACAIDGAGRVGGRATNNGPFHAFRYAAGLQDLDGFGAPFSTSEAIANGITVGWFSSPVDGNPHAFVHTVKDGAVDLNTRIPADSGWVLSQPKGVNADGWVAGMGTLDGAPRAFLLVPAIPPDKTAPVISGVSVNPSSIVPPNKVMRAVTVTVNATDDRDAAPACSVTGIDGHGAAAPDYSLTGPFSGSVRARGGAVYSFAVRCADLAGNESFASADVVVPPDTTGPAFTSLNVSPATIWPPKNQMVGVTLSATAIDDSGDAPACHLGSITTAGRVPDSDVVVTGQNTGSVRAVGGRVYSFNAVCTDSSGNSSSASTNVTVPRDTTAPVIRSLSASPYLIWPPNGKMVPVSVSVTATDDVDDMPACSISSITASEFAPQDASIKGNFNAQVRATRNGDGSDRIYTIHVTCADAAANQVERTVDVTVSKDGSNAAKGSQHASRMRDHFILVRRALKEWLVASR